jgi:hypothetical protein
MARPPLDDGIGASDLCDYYWMKAELVDWCRRRGIPSGGGKLELIERMTRFIENGDKGEAPVTRKFSTHARFDWANARLTESTVITSDYRATRNVRAFFENRIGGHFRINVPFTAWMRANAGKTLGDAVSAWKRLKEEEGLRAGPKEIEPQFEYNRYVRAFLADNPGRSRKEAVACWMEKKQRKGARVYHPDDLAFLKKD